MNLLQEGQDDELDDIRVPMSIGAQRIDKDKSKFAVKLPFP